jgi:hypothetical protein
MATDNAQYTGQCFESDGQVYGEWAIILFFRKYPLCRIRAQVLVGGEVAVAEEPGRGE